MCINQLNTVESGFYFAPVKNQIEKWQTKQKRKNFLSFRNLVDFLSLTINKKRIHNLSLILCEYNEADRKKVQTHIYCSI